MDELIGVTELTSGASLLVSTAVVLPVGIRIRPVKLPLMILFAEGETWISHLS